MNFDDLNVLTVPDVAEILIKTKIHLQMLIYCLHLPPYVDEIMQRNRILFLQHTSP